MRPLSFKKNQLGQVMPIGIFFIAMSVLLMYLLYNASELSSERSKITNAADAAVYSGLVWQARALNYQAYTNRAMVANQVAIGQLTSLTSWTDYAQVGAANIDATIGSFLPFKPYTASVATAAGTMRGIISNIAQNAIPVIDGLNLALANTQVAVNFATIGMTPIIVDKVVKANNNRYEIKSSAYAIASIADNIKQWNSFTKSYGDADGLTRKADVIQNSRDKFTRDRGWKVGRFTLPGAPIIRVELQKAGRTNLIYDQYQKEWAWKAKDGTAIHYERLKCKITGCKWKYSEIPVGWGGRIAGEDITGCYQNYGRQNCNGRWLGRNRDTESLAESYSIKSGSYSGVNPYYDLANISKDNKDPRLNMRVEVELPDNKVKTMSRMTGFASKPDAKTKATGFGKGAFSLQENIPGKTLSAIASGEVYFKRPVYQGRNQLRINGNVKKEYASLYNPYWQVRLNDTPIQNELAAIALKDSRFVSATSKGSTAALKEFSNELSNELTDAQKLKDYTQQQINTIDEVVAKEQLKVQNQINTVESSIRVAREKIQDIQNDPGEALNIAQYEQKIKSLEDKSKELKTDLAAVPNNVRNRLDTELKNYDNAVAGINGQFQRYQNQIGNIENQSTKQITSKINNLDASVTGSLASVNNSVNRATQIADKFDKYTSAGGVRLIYDAAEEKLKQVAQDKAVEVAEELAKEAIKKIIEKYGGDAARKVINSYNTTVGATQQGVDEMIYTLNDAIAKSQLTRDEFIQNNIATIRETVQQGIDEIGSNLLQAQLQVDYAFSSTEDTINDNIAQYQLELLNETDPGIRASLEQNIRDERINLSIKPQQEADKVGKRLGIDRLRNNLATAKANFNNKVQEGLDLVTKDVDADIAKLQAELNDISKTVNSVPQIKL